MWLSIWMEGVKRMEPDPSQLCWEIGQEAAGTNWKHGWFLLRIRKNFYCEGNWWMEQVSPRGCGVSLLGRLQNHLDTPKPPEPALGGSAWGGGLDQVASRGPLPHLNCSVMLWVLLPCEKTSLVLCPYFSVWLLNTHSTCLTSWHHAYRTIYTMKSSKQFTCHFTVRFYGCRIKLPLQADWNKSSCLWTDKVKIISSARWVWCCDFQFPSLICRLKHFPVGIVLY